MPCLVDTMSCLCIVVNVFRYICVYNNYNYNKICLCTTNNDAKSNFDITCWAWTSRIQICVIQSYVVIHLQFFLKKEQVMGNFSLLTESRKKTNERATFLNVVMDAHKQLEHLHLCVLSYHKTLDVDSNVPVFALSSNQITAAPLLCCKAR